MNECLSPDEYDDEIEQLAEAHHLDMEAREKMLVDALERAATCIPIEFVGAHEIVFDALNSTPSSTTEWTARFVAEWVRANWKPVMWYEAQESTNGMDVKDIIGSMMYSTAIHTKEPKTSNPVWCLYAIPDKD